MANERGPAAKDVAKEAAKMAAKQVALNAVRAAAVQAGAWLLGILGGSLLPVIGIFLGGLFIIVVTIVVINNQCNESWTFWGFAKVASWLTWTTSICDIIKIPKQ